MLDLRRLRLLRELQRARDDRRGRRRAAVHAVGGLAAARDARARGRRAAARARRPRRAPDRRGARARRARRRAARARRARRGRPRRGRRHGHRPRPHRRRSSRWRCASRCRRWRRSRATRRGCAASSSRPSPSRRCPRSRSATSTSCSATSGSTSRWRLPAGLERHELLARPGPPRAPRAATRRRAGTATPCRSPSSPARRGRPATPGMGWEEMTQRTCRELGGFDPDIRHRDQRRDGQPRARRARAGGDAAARAPAARTATGRRRAPDRRGAASRGRSSPHARRRRRPPVDAGAARRGARGGHARVADAAPWPSIFVIDIENTPGALAPGRRRDQRCRREHRGGHVHRNGDRAELHILVPRAGAARHSLAISHVTVSRGTQSSWSTSRTGPACLPT